MKGASCLLLLAVLYCSKAETYSDLLEQDDWKPYLETNWEKQESSDDVDWYDLAMRQLLKEATDTRQDQGPRARTRAQESMQQPGVGGPLMHTGGSDKGEDANGKSPTVKTDATLPSYCNPPNPCPVGMTESDGCQEKGFVNTAAYVKQYQSQQQCACDRDHMRCDEDAQSQLSSNALFDNSELLTDLQQAAVDGSQLTLNRAAKKSSDPASHFQFRSDLF